MTFNLTEFSTRTPWNVLPISLNLTLPTNLLLSNSDHLCVLSLFILQFVEGRLRGLTGSALDHGLLPPEFESRRGHIWRVFHLSLRFITFGWRSFHLAYHVLKSGLKTSIIISSWTTRHRMVIVVFVLFEGGREGWESLYHILGLIEESYDE